MTVADARIKRKAKKDIEFKKVMVHPQIHEILHHQAYREGLSIQGLVHCLLCRALKRRDLLVRPEPTSDADAAE